MDETQYGKIINVFQCENALEYRDSKLLNFIFVNGTLSEFFFLSTFQ